MKKHLIYFFTCITVFTACRKNKELPLPEEGKPESTLMEMTLNGQNLTLDADDIQALYYAESGENTGAIEINAQLPENERMVFFFDEAKEQTISLSQSFPAVMSAQSGKSGQKTAGSLSAGNTQSAQVAATSQTYIKYVNTNHMFFAISGQIKVKIHGDDLIFEWDITFKDADGKTFTSKGASTIKDYKANLRSRSQINNPGSNLAITEITPDYGKTGTEVILKGTGFSALKEENTVKLNDISLAIISASATELKVTIPENGTHGHLFVSVLGETAESIAKFYYEPVVVSADKTSAKVGDEVTLTGKHFDTDPQLLEVKLGDKVMEIIGATLTEVKFKITAGAESGKITLARKGKDAVEGPNLEITTTAPVIGIPVEELFEIVEGNLTIEEVLPNNNEYGAMLAMQIDEKNHILYAYNTQNLVAIDLTNKSVTRILDSSHPIMKHDFQPNSAYILQAIYPAGDGYLYGAKHSVAAAVSTQNVFKLNLSTKEYSFLGTGKAYNDPVNAIFVDSDKRFYIPEFIKYPGNSGSTYGMSTYDENLANMNPLTDKIFTSSNELAQLVPTGPNSFRLVGRRGYPGDIRFYRDVNNNSIGPQVDWKTQFDALLNNGDGWMLGIDHSQGNFYALYGDNNNIAVTKYPKFTYSIGVTNGNDGPFERKGRFNIIKTFEEGKYMRAYHSLFNVFAADKNGSIYMLVQGAGNLSAAGGIYKISFN